MRRPRILVADDLLMLREVLTSLLEPYYDVVGAVGDGRALLEVAEQLRPDLVLMEVDLPLLNGIDAARQLRREHPGIQIVFLTSHGDPDLVSEALAMGAAGYVLKNGSTRELQQAIQEIIRGRSYVSPLAARGPACAPANKFATTKKSGVLTLRRREVLQLLAEGRTMKSIARLLKITSRTVAFHKYTLMKELAIKTNAELVRYAVRHHVVGV